MTTLLPPPIRRSAGYLTVTKGATLSHVLAQFGQPPSSYPDLTAANLAGEITMDGVPAGLAARPLLRPGSRLNIPAGWLSREQATALRRRGVLSGTPGVLADELVDRLASFSPYTGSSGLTEAQYQDLLGVLAAWWRRDNGTALPTNPQALGPYMDAFRLWAANVARNLPPGVAARIPWASLPVVGVWRWHLSKLPIQQIDWAVINRQLVQTVSPGQFPKTDRTVSWAGVSFSTEVLRQEKLTPAFWLMLTMPRWDLLPLNQIDPNSYPGGNPTRWLSNQIVRLTGKPAPTSRLGDGEEFTSLPLGFPVKNLPGQGAVTCGFGQVAIGQQCYALAVPNIDGSCPDGSFAYGQASARSCVVSPCSASQNPTIVLGDSVSCTGQGVDPKTVDALSGGTKLATVDATPLPAGGSDLPAGGILNPGQWFPPGTPGVGTGQGQNPLGVKACPKGSTQTSTSCDCSPLGGSWSYNPDTNECVNCGPNSQYDSATDTCFCDAGYQWVNGDGKGTFGGCVPIQGSGGGQPQGQGGKTEITTKVDNTPSLFSKVVAVSGLFIGAIGVWAGLRAASSTKR